MRSTQRIWNLSCTSKSALLQALQARDFSLDDAGEHLDYRIAILASTNDELRDHCDRAITLVRETSADRLNASNRIFFGHCPATSPPGRLAFVFPGYGAHYPDMFSGLYTAFPFVKDWFENLSSAHRTAFRTNPLLFANTAKRGADLTSGELVTATLVMNLALFKLINALGIGCDCAVGHSHGENAALASAGMLADPGALFDTVRKIVARAAGRTTPRQMLAMRSIPEQEIQPPLYLALDNCPSQIIASGPVDAIAKKERQLRNAGELSFRLDQVTEPVHTPDFPLTPDTLKALYRPVEIYTSAFPVYCCQTTRPFPEGQEQVIDLLARQWREPVRFRETIKAMHHDGVRTFVEVGPAGRLSGFIRDTLRGADAITLATDLEKQTAMAQIQVVVARLFSMGYPVDPDHIMLNPGVTDAGEQPTDQPAKPGIQEKWHVGQRQIQNDILHLVAELLDASGSTLIDPDLGFFALGMSSLDVIALVDRLSEQLGEEVPYTTAFDHPTPRLLARFLDSGDGPESAGRIESVTPQRSDDPVAIIGMACRFPGDAYTPERFWTLLTQGVDAIGASPTDRWDNRRYPNENPKSTVSYGGFLRDVKTFDAAFFNLSPREAITLDPQQRLLLEVTWEALENAAIPPSDLNGGAAGVFIGISSRDYAERLSPAERIRQTGYIATGNAPSAGAGRISHFLGTTGPSLAIDTACSSSLVAVDLACRSLVDGDSNLAIAGGVNLILSPELTGYLESANALAADGHCKTFDASADGYVRSEGCGILILKRLSDAIAQGDPVLALIRGSATNHTGHSSGLTVPNSRSQEKLIRHALARSGIEPEDIDYVEAHGTGTQLGDPIELNALSAVFSGLTSLPIASVKTNIGHLEAAAGVAGLMKLVLQLQHRQIAPHLNLDTPTPALNWEQTPFEVPLKLGSWPERGRERTGGVSSFGISGTNAHVIVAQAPEPATPKQSKDPGGYPILTISARDPVALESLAKRYRDTLTTLPDNRLADFCYTSNLGRQHFPHRIAIIGNTIADMAQELAEPTPGCAGQYNGCAFLFTGQGAQYSTMGHDLYRTEPVFRDTFDQCTELFDPDLKQPLRQVVFDPAVTELDQTGYSQPAIFSLQIALTTLWHHWGVEADAVIGHSIGEYAAAVTAKVLTLSDAAKLVGARARMMQALPSAGPDRGAMIALRTSEEAVGQLLFENSIELALAAVNGPENIVLSGLANTVDEVRILATERGINCRILSVSHAFHSSLMASVADPFRELVESVNLQLPNIPFISTVSGKIESEALLDPAFWARQICSPVRFADGVSALKETGLNCHLEIGPGITLTALSQELIPAANIRRLPSLRQNQNGCQQIRQALAALYADGAAINWAALHPGQNRKRARLPNYPFQRQTFWIDDHYSPELASRRHGAAESPATGTSTSLKSTSPTQPGPGTLGIRLRSDADALSAYLQEQVCLTIGLARNAQLKPTSSFAELGMDSMMAAMLSNQVGTTLTVPLAVAAVARCQSFNDFVSLVTNAIADRPGPMAIGTHNAHSTEPMPLSEGQKALWYLWRLAPESTAYNQSLPIVFSEDPGSEQLSLAWHTLVRRHAMLRCCFPNHDGRPIVTVLPEDSAVDYQTIENAGHPDQISHQLVETHNEPFDISSAPPVRIRSFQGSQGVTTLLTMHHIICDGWSLEILYRELVQLVAGQPLSVLRGSYRDYVAWESAMLSGSAGKTLATHWQKVLRSPLPVTDLPTDFARPALQTYIGELYTRALKPALVQNLKALARHHHTTLFTVTLAGWFLLLYRYSGQSDMLVSTPTAGRSQSDQTEIVGYFINPVVIRGKVEPAQSVAEFLESIRDCAQDAMAHAEYPFPLLAQLINPVRNPSRSPLADISFNYVADLESIRPETATGCTTIDIPQAAGKFDLTANIIDSPSNPRLVLGYNRDLFRQATIAQMTNDFEKILTAFTVDPERTIADLPLSGKTGCALSTPAISKTKEAPTVVQLLRQQAKKTPDQLAVFSTDGCLTYQQLNQKSDALASSLQQDHVDSESVIGLIAPRNADALAAIFGILKSGAPYLAIDPSTPPGLVQTMLDECNVETIIGSSSLIPTSVKDRRAILLEQLADGSSPYRPPLPDTTQDPERLAYIMYTSGSSGRSKGVEITHAALSTYVEGVGEVLDIRPGDTFAHVSTLAADLGNTALFPTLATGGCIHMLNESLATDINAITDYFSQHRIDYLKIVPSHLDALLQDGAAISPLPQKKLILGGESASPALIQKIRDLAPDLTIINHYGPTETTIGVLTHSLIPGVPYQGSKDLPLGTPLPGCSVHLVDSDLRLVPQGAIGEIVLSGQCLARGYHNQKALTQESFITLALTDDGGKPSDPERSYRTGDLARLDANGKLHFIGRADRQCKVRGYRVEPSHIENTILSIDEINQCRVLATTNTLAAFIVSRQAIAFDRLRSFLESRLPGYMVPGRFITLEKLPLTANGKVDNHALEAMLATDLVQHSSGQVRDLTELKLTRIWEEILGLPLLGIREDFFRLGGHSLLAVRLAWHIEQEFDVSVPLAAFYSHPTIETQAELIRSSGAIQSPTLIPLSQQVDTDPVILLPGAGGNTFYLAELAARLGARHQVWGLQALHQRDGDQKALTSIHNIAARYLTVLDEAGVTNPCRLIGHSFGALVAFEMACQLHSKKAPVEMVGIIDNPPPIQESSTYYQNWDHADWLVHIGIRMRKIFHAEIELDADSLRAMSNDEQNQWFAKSLVATGLLPKDTSTDYLGHFVELYRSNAIAGVHYRPGRLPADVPLAIFCAEDRDAQLTGPTDTDDNAIGWSHHAERMPYVARIPGTHITMLQKPNVNALADQITRFLVKIKTHA